MEPGTPEELEAFAKWMALAQDIMRTDRDLLLQLRDLNLKEEEEE